MIKKIKNINKIILISILISTNIFVSCAKYSEEDIIFKYEDYQCAYYEKSRYEKYKYSDYIVDDITNEEYLKSSPSIADYKTGNGAFDTDIEKYVSAKLDYALKLEMIKRYKYEINDICAKVKDDYYTQKISKIYYHDITTDTHKLLSEKEATNISYDNETPLIAFDVDDDSVANEDNAINKKIMLSDIIASNVSPEGYMQVILAKNKIRKQFIVDLEVEKNVATNSNITE